MTAMAAHVMAAYARTTQLDMAATRFNLSTTRGMGPGRQSEPLAFDELAALDLNSKVKNPKYPVMPGWCVVFCFLSP